VLIALAPGTDRIVTAWTGVSSAIIYEQGHGLPRDASPQTGASQPVTKNDPNPGLVDAVEDIVAAHPPVERLVVSTAGVANTIPWVVPVERSSPAVDGRGDLVAVTTVPSLTVFRRPRRTPLNSPRASVLCHADGLRYAAFEAETVAKTWGVDAQQDGVTRDRGLQSIAASDVVHFACHGHYQVDNPLKSGIRLMDGDLSAADLIYHHSSLELLVLSACATGVEAALPGSNAVGLAAAFLRAGVRSMLVSLWPVDDEATSVMMQVFHHQARRGCPLDRALRAAQAEVANNPRWSEAYYWSSFELIGDPGPLTVGADDDLSTM
jgi:hypothetical protein